MKMDFQQINCITSKTHLINDLKDSCRICMGQIGKMREIFNTQSNIIEQVEFCTGILLKNEEHIPTRICQKCFTDLSVAHKFKSTCILVNDTFRNLVLPKIKVELSDEPYHNDEPCYNDEPCHNDDDIKCEELDKVKEELIKSENDLMNNDVMMIDDNVKSANVPIIAPRKPRAYKKGKTPKKLKKYTFKRLTCISCDVKFSSKAEFKKHKESMHNDNQTWMCEVCGKEFTHRGSLYSHARSHSGPKFRCDHCDYATWQKYDLVKHVRIHTGVKQYQCHFCTLTYRTSSNLSGHIRRFHEQQRPHSCHLCDRKFFDSTKLNRHIDSHNEIRRYECDVCHSFFTRRCYWKKHMYQHHGIVIPPQRPGRKSKWETEKLLIAAPVVAVGNPTKS